MSDRPHVILAVDDDPDVLDFLRVVLEAEGYRFVGAATAEEGLRAYEGERPDAIIVDLMMEEVDSGTSLIKELQRRGNDRPVFLLSSVGDDLHATLDVSELGLAGVLQKPLKAAHLLPLLDARML